MLTTIVTACSLLCFSFIIYSYVRKRFNNASIVNKIPGPKQHFLVGSMNELLTSTENIWTVLRTWAKLYYPVYKYWVINECVVNLLDPDDVEIVLSSTTHSSKSKIYEILHPWLGTGLLTSAGAKWHSRRKILTPAFHFNILQQFLKVFVDQSEFLIKELEGEVEKDYTDVTSFISQFTLQSISETAMGTPLNLSRSTQEYRNSIFRMGEILVFRLTRPWTATSIGFFFSPKRYEHTKLINILHNFTSSVIQKRMLNFKESNLIEENDEDESSFKKKRLAMLDLLISAKNSGQAIDDEGIREEVDTFMFEGHDTTSACISFTLLALACHPDIQEKVYQEIEQVLDPREKYTYQNLQMLTYLERVIKESLRMFPSVPFISRVSDEDITTKSGYVVPKNAIIQLHIYDMHHNPKVFPNPEVFDPERFSSENSQKRHPFAYVPFSAGPRNCIGQRFAMLEIKCVIAAIIRNYILRPIDTFESLIMVVNLVLKSKNGIKVKFLKRN